MRLNQLVLTRYGKFTDYRIEFGDTGAGKSDLHIVYGANEAGKTTVLSAFLDLLFGIEMQSRFNFLHPYQTMRIVACLEHAGERHDVIRVKRQQNTLLDGRNEQPVPERLIGAQLGGIDRDSYRAMFSLDDDTIEKGGESILASKGDLGQLLFAAAAGLSDLSHTLTRLRAEADEFYRPNARFGGLAQFKSEIARRKEERLRIDMFASDFKQMTDARERALEQYEAACAERAAVQGRLSEVQALLRALPRLRDLRALRDRLAPLAELADAPAGWVEEVARLQRDEISISVQLQRTESEIARRQAELAGISLDAAALSVAERVDGWHLAHDRAKLAALDIPARQREVVVQEAELAGIVRRTGQNADTDPRALLLGPASLGDLRALIESHSGVEMAARTAQAELKLAQHRLAAAQEKLHETAPDIPAADEAQMSVVAAAVAGVTADDHSVRGRLAQRSRDEAIGELADRLSALRPWSGDIEQLATLRAPDEAQLQSWKAALAAAEKRVATHSDSLARLQAEQLPLHAQREAIATTAGVVTDGEAGAIRAAREEAWASHRRTLDSSSAGVFEAALRRDDIVTDARLRHEKDIARLQQMAEALAVLQARWSRETELLQHAQAGLQAVHDSVAAAVVDMTPLLARDIPIAQLEGWLRKRERAMETRARLQHIEGDLLQAGRDAAQARARLVAAMTAAGISHDPAAEMAALLAIAQAALAREAKVAELRQDIVRRRQELALREQAAAAAVQEDAAWQVAWQAACAGCWLRTLGAAPGLAVVREILQACVDLAPVLERRDTLLARIEAMQEDQRSFAAEVAAVARTLGQVTASGDTLALANAIIKRVQHARQARDGQITRTQELEGILAEQRGLLDARAHHARRRGVMTQHFGVDSLDAVAGKLHDSETKRDLQAQAASLERQIIDELRPPSIADAEATLDRADRAALETELNDLQSRFEAQDQRVQRLYADHRRAHELVEAVDGDGAVARLEEERRTLLLQIEDGAARYLRLRVGIAAAEHALRLYRHRHQSSMMAQASKAFRTITRGAYTGLTSQPDKDREILVAIAADGSSREADKLSKGTRFQLYLALRVAGYHEFARQRHPVPFIADDIMETFDDFRAEEAIRLFAEMGTVGQVIYLTHHRHLCEIARKVCPEVHLHDLSASAV